MGLDAVEIVLRTEEFFGVAITDEEAAAVRTVGDLYSLVCSKLELQPIPSPFTSEMLPKVTEKEKVFLFLAKHSPYRRHLRFCRGPHRVSGIASSRFLLISRVSILTKSCFTPVLWKILGLIELDTLGKPPFSNMFGINDD